MQRAAFVAGRHAHLEQVERAYRVERIYEPLGATAVDEAVAPSGVAEVEVPVQGVPSVWDLVGSAELFGITVAVRREQFYARVTATVKTARGQYAAICGNLSYGQMRAFPRARLTGAAASDLVRLLIRHAVD